MGGPSKTLLRPSDAQDRKQQTKLTKTIPEICSKTVKKLFKKWAPKKGRKTQPNSKKLSPFHYLFWGVGAPSEGPALLYPLSLTNSLASTTFLFVLGHLQRENQQNEDNRSFAKSVVASFVLRSSFSLASGISLGALFLTLWY